MHICSSQQSYPPNATTLYFESQKFGETSGSSAGSRFSVQATPVFINDVHLQTDSKIPSEIMEDILSTYNIPKDKRMGVFTHLRLACNFAKYESRLHCVQARLQALSVLVYLSLIHI